MPDKSIRWALGSWQERGWNKPESIANCTAAAVASARGELDGPAASCGIPRFGGREGVALVVDHVPVAVRLVSRNTYDRVRNLPQKFPISIVIIEIVELQ